MADRRRRRASLRFRRTLRLYFADGRGLCRQYHDDPRPRGSREAGRGRALVDPRPVGSGRRGLPVGGVGVAPLPPSAALRRPAVCQLLASRPVHSRYLGPVAAEADRARQYQPGFPASDPHVPAHSAETARPRHHDRGRRGRGQALAVARRPLPGSTTSPTSARRSRSRPIRSRASTSTAARSRR